MTHQTFACRSLLFVPGSRPDRIPKALATQADLVAIDLEDAVLADQKETARQAVCEVLADEAADRRRIAVRINGTTTLAGLTDLVALAGRAPRTVLVPKVESARDVEIVAAALGGDVAIVPLIETVRGIRAAHSIAACPGTAAIMFGGADFAAEIGVTLAFEPLLAARQSLVMAAAHAQKPVIDVPHVQLKDLDGLAAEATRVAALGFSGKAAIHPTQVAPINTAFTPTAAEVERARAVVETFRTSGVAQLDGEFVEGPIVRRYERILTLVDHSL
ncbi:CoA ester lyase [Acuticoccus sp. I52.16.1]|uniref:HpcH/HpaI aldolase/citrate lyase family protein n=1 Tax=Acuticoccus sp. I52.16.1 TaxID=2928472 RepID=UPI001FD493E7|nr:CoA ester lyase [Acuticoccus sp. I52.16.1]UOM32968.1 CoA ester lyase [Acuticoccus sp. I52.16.1]